MKKGIYIVKNRVADVNVTDVFSCENDKMAIVGFNKFLEKQPLERSCYVLYRLFFFDISTLEETDCFPAAVCFGQNAEREVADIVASLEA